MGILLGKRDRKGASEVFSATLTFTIAVGIVLAVIGAPFSMSLGALLADGGELSGLTGQYIMASFLGAPIIGIALQMMNYLGAENHPQLASAYLISANVINLILDFIFLKFTPLGTAGAALSTVLGYLLGMAVFVFYIRSPKRMISFHFPKTFRPLAEAARAGVPMLIFMVMSFVKALGLNFIIISTLGNEGMSILRGSRQGIQGRGAAGRDIQRL